MNASVKPTGPRPSDKWIPWYLALFFVALGCVLGPMAYLAVHTLPGTVTQNAYEEGLAYNKAIAAGAQQQALGWRGEVTMEAVEGQATAHYQLHDAQGKNIDDADVHVWLVRPAQNGMDRDVVLSPAGNGVYAATFMLPAHGVWDVRVSATRGGENFQTLKRIVVP